MCMRSRPREQTAGGRVLGDSALFTGSLDRQPATAGLPPGAPQGRALAQVPLSRLQPSQGHPSLRGQWQGGSLGQESSNSTGSRPCWAAVLWAPMPGALPLCGQLPCKHSIMTGPSMPSFPRQVPLQKSRKSKGIFKWRWAAKEAAQVPPWQVGGQCHWLSRKAPTWGHLGGAKPGPMRRHRAW